MAPKPHLTVIGAFLTAIISTSNGADDGRCANTRSVSLSYPSLAMHSFDLAMASNSFLWSCYEAGCAGCRLILDLSMSCASDGKPEEACPNPVPYVVNGEVAKWENCKISIQGEIKFQRCLSQYSSPIHLFWDGAIAGSEETKMRSGFSVRLANYTNHDDQDYRLEVLNMVDGRLIVTEEKVTKSLLYVGLLLPANRLKRLLRMESGNPECEYDLILGPMVNPNGSSADQVAMHITDGQPLSEAPLVIASYTVTVPHGCAPTIEVSLEEQTDWFNITQRICDGEAFLVPQGFVTNVDSTKGYYLQRLMYCPDHLIDMVIELHEVDDGVLTIDFLDSQQRSIDSQKLIFNRTRLLPSNHSIQGVYGANVHWNQKGLLNFGFLMNVLVTRSSFTPSTVGSTISSGTTKTIATTKPPIKSSTGAATKSTAATTRSVTDTPVTKVTVARTSLETRPNKVTSPLTSTITSTAAPSVRFLSHLLLSIFLMILFILE